MLSKFPRYPLTFGPTPIEKLGRLTKHMGGKVELFDNAGRLRRVTDKNGNFIAMEPSKDGKIAKLQDNSNRKMFFTFNRQGLLERIEGENGGKAFSEDYAYRRVAGGEGCTTR